MSKALVLHDVDFSTNKLDTVTVSEDIPCTSVALSQSTISFTTLGATVQLTTTLTPNNTTDSVEWSTSNGSVASVSAGLVTCTGVGSATITATCGTQSATCTVTSTIEVNANTAYTAENGHGFYSTTTNYANKRSQTYSRLYYSDTDILGGYQAFYGTNTGYAIPIPTGASAITVTVPDGFSTRPLKICAVDTTTRAGSSSSMACATVLAWASDTPDANKQLSLSLENVNANGFMFEVQCPTNTDASTVTGDVKVTFS